jgi:hypothetical protein
MSMVAEMSKYCKDIRQTSYAVKDLGLTAELMDHSLAMRAAIPSFENPSKVASSSRVLALKRLASAFNSLGKHWRVLEVMFGS